MKFKTYIETELPPIWRRPKWTALLVALTGPIAKVYAESVETYQKLKRRAACDGSVIALEYLIHAEFGIRAKIVEPSGSGRAYMKQRYEELRGLKLHERGQGWLRLYPRGGSGLGDYDYTVKLQQETTKETAQRIHAVAGIYNSAGFTYKVEQWTD